MNTLTNYDHSIETCPSQLVYPTAVAEIQAVMRDRHRFPSPVRAKGSYHSLTPCVSTQGTVVDMTRMNKILSINRERMTFTAEAGLQIIDASKALRSAGLQFFTNIEIGNMTLGSAACCQSKDALDGIEFGQFSSYVSGLKWVNPDGALEEVSQEDCEGMRFMRSSYGLAGIVYEVTLRVKPIEAIHFSYLPRRIRSLTEQDVDRIIDSSEGLICWTVGDKAHFQTRRVTSEAGILGRSLAAVRRKLWNDIEARAGRFIDSKIPAGVLRDASLDAWFAGTRLMYSVLHAIGGFSLPAPDKTVDYRSTPESARYAFTFWAFPRDHWLGCLREYIEFSDEHFRKYGFRCNMPLGSYFIRKDISSLLSYSFDGDIFSIDPIHASTNRADWELFLHEFNDFAYKRGGVPLLNQSPFTERKHVVAAYGPRWTEFSTQVRTRDPGGRMLNPFFDSLLT